MVSRIILVFSFVLLHAFQGNAQDISSISSARPFKVSGSFFGAVSYTDNESTLIPPFGYNAGVHLNISIYNALHIPLSYNYSNYGNSFSTLQLERFGISPSYKTVKLHLGYRSFFLTPYLMSGMTVKGAGIEFTPKKFQCKVFYGTLVDRYTLGNEFIQLNNPDLTLYKRKVLGFRLGFGKESNRIALSAYKSMDDDNIITSDSLRRLGLFPRENLVVGADMHQVFFRYVTLQANAALSILTKNVYGDSIEDVNAQKWLDRTRFIMTVNQTSTYAFAYDARLSLRLRTFHLGIKYQHIDPFFTTTGVPFLQQNYENYLLDISGGLFKSRVTLMGNAGLQFINKGGFTGLPQKRIVGTLNANWLISKGANLNISYTNFAQNTNLLVAEVNDSLTLTANNTGYTATFNLKPGKGKERPHLILLSASGGTFDIVSGDTITSQGSSINGNLTYKFTRRDGWNYGGGLQTTYSEASTAPPLNRYGVVAHIGKRIADGLQFRSNASIRLNETGGIRDGFIFNSVAALTYAYKKKHSLHVNVSFLSRQTTILAAKNETRIRFNYNYSF